MAKVAVFIADGSEEVEAITPVDLLRRAKVDVDVVSVMDTLEITASRNVKITADKLIGDINFDEYDLLMLPGGVKGTNNLNSCELLKKQLYANVLIQLIANSASPLYKDMYEQGLINNVFSTEVFFGDGYFTCIFDGESNEPLKVRDKIIEEIERIKREGIDSERFEIIKKSIYGAMVWEFNNTEICVNNLTSSGLMNVELFDTIDMLAAMTENDLLESIDTIFDTKRVAVSIIQN